MLTVEELLQRPVVPGEVRRHYEQGAAQFGDLYLPAGSGPHPVLILIHGGCWRAAYHLDHLSGLAAALAETGLAVWNLEFRRVGDEGGGWPGTFRDVAQGALYVRELAEAFNLDMERIVAAGHSAGGHLALWLAARAKLEPDSPAYVPGELPLRGVVGLAPIPDLAAALEQDVCRGMPAELMGGRPEAHTERYRQASPVEMLPLSVPQQLLVGDSDPIVPPGYVQAYSSQAEAAGDEVTLSILPEAGHFELVVPGTVAWPAVQQAIWSLIRS